jgi:hypothetical protein
MAACRGCGNQLPVEQGNGMVYCSCGGTNENCCKCQGLGTHMQAGGSTYAAVFAVKLCPACEELKKEQKAKRAQAKETKQ